MVAARFKGETASYAHKSITKQLEVGEKVREVQRGGGGSRCLTRRYRARERPPLIVERPLSESLIDWLEGRLFAFATGSYTGV